MVDQSQLETAASLTREYGSIANAIRMFEGGQARIVAMIVAPEVVEQGDVLRPGVFPGSVTVPTDSFDYPEPMIAGIKQQMLARQTAIREQLRQMGVTGLAVAASVTPQRRR